MEKNFTHCPHCAVRGRDRIIQPATRRTPHLSRSDGMTFHLFLEELNVRPRDGHDPHSRELIALFRYDLEPAQKAESAMIQLGPAADTEEKAPTRDLINRGNQLCRLDRVALHDEAHAGGKL